MLALASKEEGLKTMRAAQQEACKGASRYPSPVVDQELRNLNQANVFIGNIFIILFVHPLNYVCTNNKLLLSKILF